MNNIRINRVNSTEDFLKNIYKNRVSPTNPEYTLFARNMINKYYTRDKNDAIVYMLTFTMHKKIIVNAIRTEADIETFLNRSNYGNN